MKVQQPTPNKLEQMDNETPVVTVDKIIEKSKQWTLEGDCSLLQWMNQISKNLEERVSKTSSAINDLSTSLNRTSVALSNATNNLAALQYSQFVENRVHDDDETLANISEVPNPVADVTDNKDANHNIYSFLKKNLEMMNSCHEAYSISYDDSDEDEPATNVVYRSKNPYEARSLPHIYGSSLWKEKWHIGLCDSDNDYSGDENSEQFSESSSTADDSYESTAPTMSEWDSTAWGLNKNHLAEREEIHTPSNDGESSYQGENYSQSDISTPRAHQRTLPIVQPVQDQRYYQHVPRKEEALFDDIFTDAEQQLVITPTKKKISQENLISNEPPPDLQPIESDNRRIGAKKTLNLFDDDEFSSFMDQIVQKASNKTSKSSDPPEEKLEPPKKVAPNLFDDSEDIFTPKVSQAPVVKRQAVPQTLEDDIFMPPPLPAVSNKTGIRNLFDDDDDDDDFENIFAAKPSGSNQFAQKTKNLFEDDMGDLPEEPHGGDLVPDEVKISEVIKVPLVKEATVKEVPLMRKGLFDDDEDDLEAEDEIFSTKPMKNDLFEDIFSKRKKNDPIPKHDLFGDVDAGKEDFAKAKTPEVSPEMTDQSDTSIPRADSISKTKLFADVFQDEPVEDIFAIPVVKKKTKIADIFADDFTDDFNEIIPKTAVEPPAEDNLPSDSISLDPDSIVDLQSKALPDIAQKPIAPKIGKKPQEELKKNSDVVSKPTISTVDKEDISIPPINDFTADVDVPSEGKHSTSSISNEDLPTVSPKITENPDVTLEAKQQPTHTVPSYTGLFEDEPPPDDEDVNAPSYEQPTKYPTGEDVIISTPPYNNINLFADVPPDDDFAIGPPVETKRIHSIFYDDFHETIEASREMRAPSTYIFNEEPPPDDEDQVPKPTVEVKPKVVEEKKDKPKVSKLKKMDLQINVGALLPTAKIPLFKKPETASVLISAATSRDEDMPRKVPTPKSPDNRDLPENILPNLNRDRAKVQLKRRPSTRRGRQESYRKSLIVDDLEATEPVHDEEEEGLRKSTSLFDDFGTFDVKKSSPTAPEPSGEILTTKTNTEQMPELEEKKEIPTPTHVEKRSSTQPASSKLSSLFEESDNDAGNIFETVRSNAEKPSQSAKPNALDSLFDSDGIDENPFGTPTKPLVESISSNISVDTIPQLLPKINPQSTVSLFDGSDSGGENQSVLAAPPAKTLFKHPEKLIKSTPKSSTLFGESDDGSDDLFKESKIPKKPAPQKTIEKKSKPKLVSQQAKATSSLFSSDEESASGEDIFGKTKTKVAAKKIESVKVKPSTSLFADLSDDDDDDLFGTTKKKSTGVERSKLKPSSMTSTQPTKTPALAQHQTVASNNPLSDLLGP